MAINTASKRSAALGYGSPWRSGTRPPSGSISEFDRSALLGCYNPAAADGLDLTPNCGWVVKATGRVWSSEAGSRIWSSEAGSRIWTVGDC